MNSASRASLLRLTITALIALTALLALTAVAQATTVKLRVETADQTLFNGSVNTGSRTLLTEDQPGTDASYCDADGAGDAPAAGPNGNTAVADSGLDYGSSGNRYPGFGAAICRIGAFPTTPSNSWAIKINNKIDGYNISGSTPVVDGDTVLWYFGGYSIDHTLDLAISATAQPGVPVEGVVNSWANSDDAKTSPSGVQIAGGGIAATSGADGKFSVTFPAPGDYLLRATDGTGVPGSARVHVDPATPAAPLPKKVNRFAKCARVYPRKASKKYKRCIRIVRAKQRAEKSKA